MFIVGNSIPYLLQPLNILSDGNRVTHSGNITGGLNGDGVTRFHAITVFGQANQLHFAGGNAIGSVTVLGANNTLGGYGKITGQFILGNNNAFNIQAGKALNATDSVTIGNDVVANIMGVSQRDQVNSVFLHSDTALNGNFSELRVGGARASSTDYLTASMTKTGQDYTLNYGLNWYSNQAAVVTGNFTLENATDEFAVDTALTNVSTIGGFPVGNNALWDGNSLTKKGAGTLILNELNTYTGQTDIQAGKLVVGGSATHANAQVAGNVGVQSGAILGGHGKILGDVNLLSGATLAPGNSIGTLTVNNITFNAGSTYEFEANPDGVSDHLNVVDTATLNGGAVKVLAGTGVWNPSTTYTILTAGTAVNGTFAGTSSNLAFLTPTLNYDATNVYLTLARNSAALQSVAHTHNQMQTASAIGTLATSNPIINTIVGSMDAATARRAYDNLSGEIYASTSSALLYNSRYVRDALNNRLLGERGVGVAGSFNGSAWVSLWGHKAEHKSNGNAAKVKNEGAGFLIGVDKTIAEHNVVGIAAGYEHSNISADERSSKSKGNALHLALYGGTQVSAIDLRAGIGYSKIDLDTDRSIWINTLSGKNEASYDANLWQAFIEAGHTFELTPQASVMPYLNLAYAHLDTGGIQERHSATALKVDGRNDDVTYTTVGVNGKFKVADRVNLYGDLGWQHAFGDTTPQSKNYFRAGSMGYNIKGTPIAKDSAIIGLGVGVKLNKSINLSMGYQGAFGDDTTDNSGQVRLEYQF